MDVGSISEDHDQRTANLMKCSDPKGNTDVDAVAGSSGSSNCNAARYKLMSPAKLPISRSPCITIPPGLSPTAFLESPVLLSNMKVEPSPTTGSFCKSQMMFNTSGSASLSPVINSSSSLEGSKIAFFEFNRSGSNFVAGSSMVASMVPTDSNHERSEHSRIVQEQGQPQSPASANAVKSELAVIDIPPEADSNELTRKGYPNSEVQASQLDHRGSGSSFLPERTSEDGYNWRKYGQKLVKGSEFPRSYYKCTHPNCEVKKLFERSPDGQIKEIMYKGTHDHPKPQPSRRLSAGSMMSMQEERCSKFSPLAGQEDKPTSMYGQIGHSNEPNGTPELSPCAANETGVEAEVPQSTRIQEDIDEDDDPFAKRRKMEIGGMDVSSLVKPIREPRVVVQTVSEVDILDDGYRWRKYGQKVVRGNPNPRSYYKCTSAGCPVRKHVERASHDPKAVITTYEGKHNHDVPCAKNSSHDTTAAATASRIRSQEGEPVSLDLGVGMTSAATGGIPNQQQGINASAALPGQPQISGSNYLLVQATPISSYPGYVNGAMMLYGSRESSHGHQGQGTVGITPVNHSANPYQQNVGRLLMGP